MGAAHPRSTATITNSSTAPAAHVPPAPLRFPPPAGPPETPALHPPAAGTLQDPERDQLAEARRQPAQRRGGREQRDRGEQHPLSAVPVAEPAGRRDGDCQAHQKGDRDPVHGGGAYPEVTTDGRQRDVDDRRVQNGHEHRGDEDDADRYLLADPRGHSILSPRQRPAGGSPIPPLPDPF